MKTAKTAKIAKTSVSRRPGVLANLLRWVGFLTSARADSGPSIERGGEAARGRKNLFGRADLAQTYRRARELLVRHAVFRMVRVSAREEGGCSLVICNLWRIDRSEGGAIEAFEFDLPSGQWRQARDFDSWPHVPLCPVGQARGLDWWRDVARRAICKALLAAGYDALPRHAAGGPEAVADKPEMSPGKMAHILIERYIGRVASRSKTGRQHWEGGFLKPEVMTAGARALRAAIFDHLLEAELLSAILAIDYALVTLSDYLRYATRRQAVLQVARKHRNLLPLLPRISPDYWDRQELFSHKLWVRNGRERTVVDYARFAAEPSQVFQSLESPSALRWLCKAQLSVVRHWASPSGGCRNAAVLENLGQANITVRIPAIAWRHIMTASSERRLARLGVGEPARRLYRAFAAHCARMWKDQGFAALKAWLEGQHLIGDVADWLEAEGLARGFPDRHATWESLQRHSDDWHERVALENIERGAGENRTWDSLLGEVVIDEVVFTPLNSTKDVAIEGYRQHHCVGNYAEDCAEGCYRVYAVLEPGGARSTLGLSLDQSGRWLLEQHRGKHNGALSARAAQAGRELASRYQQAHLERAPAA